MSTTIVSIIAGAIVLGIAMWKGRKILISKNDNGDYELEISNLKKELKKTKMAMEKEFKTYRDMSNEINAHINTKGMNMKKLRAIIKK